MPRPPRVEPLVPTSQLEPITWRYTTTPPPDHWFQSQFDDRAWQAGPAGFGTEGTPGAVPRTRWDSKAIWLRRDFSLAEPVPNRVASRIHHDEDVQVYIHGQRVLSRRG